MSEFLAEAKVLISPDTTRFRADLEKALLAATKQVGPIKVPVVAAVAEAGLAGALASTAGLAAAQETLQKTTLGLTTDEAALTKAFGGQAVILQGLTAATVEQAGAQKVLDDANKRSAARLGQFQKGVLASAASLTGLRGAVLAASGPFLAAAVAAAALGKSVQSFIDFQRSLNVFAATTGATADELERVSEAARELGADITLPAVTAADAAEAMLELSKAGLSVEDSLAGARGVLQLSTAAQIDTGEAAQFAANELNAFGLAGDQATRVADVLANAANAAQGSIQDFGLAFEQSSAVARQVGLSLEQTSAQLVILARNGLQGSDAGTSLRVALLRLINPTKEASQVIQRLGIDLRDAQGNLRPDVFVQFGEATANLAPAMRDAAFATVFGADAIRTVAIAAREGRDSLVEATAEVNKIGTASKLAQAQTQGFGGQLEALNSGLQTAGTTIGRLTAFIAGPFITVLGDATAGLNRILDPLNRFLDLAGKLKGPDFDPSTASAAELLERLKELQDVTQGFQGEKFEIGIAPAIERVITALKAQREELQALGVDTSGLDQTIGSFESQLAKLENRATGVTTELTPLQRALRTVNDEIAAAGKDVDTSGLERLRAALERAIAAAQRTANFEALRDGIDRLGVTARSAADGVETLTSALKTLGTQSAATQAELLKLQTEGGTPQQQIAVLQSDIDTQREIIAEAKRKGGPGSATAIKKAREQILADQAQIDSLQAQIQSDAEAAAREAKTRADKIAQAQEDATKAFISAFDPKEQRIRNQITSAALTERLSDDIKFEKQLLAFLIAERNAIKERIKRLHLHGDALKAAQAAIATINQEIFDTTNEIAKDQAAQQERTRAILEQKIDLRIRIAQAQGNVPAEIKARRARLELITKELVKLKNAGKKNTLAWLELKAQQAEEIAAIKELEGKTKEKDNAQKSLFFEFLQTQAGFASNLLGNLIPGFATSGLVGGITGGGDTGLRQVPGGFEQPRGGVEAAAAVSSARDRGVRPIQVDTTNQLLRQILRVLQNVNGRQGHPEARYQDHAARAAFDGVHGN